MMVRTCTITKLSASELLHNEVPAIEGKLGVIHYKPTSSELLELQTDDLIKHCNHVGS